MNFTESLEIKDKRLKAPITKVYSRRRKLEINSHDPRIDPETGISINTQKFDSHDDLKLLDVKKLLGLGSSSYISVFSFWHLSPHFETFATQCLHIKFLNMSKRLLTKAMNGGHE